MADARVDLSQLEPGQRGLYEEAPELAEAIVRAWAMVRLPKYMAENEVLFIEKEISYDYPLGDAVMRQMSRPDVVERRRSDGAIFVRNFKTSSDPGKNWKDSFRYDQQVLMEALAAEALVGGPVQGTIIEGLAKGRKSEYPKGSGLYYHDSPLIWCWKKEGDDPLSGPEYFARYEWSCTGPHKMSRGNCPGNRNHKLSGAHKVPVWRDYPGGVVSWLNHLVDTDPDLVMSQFLELPPILRSEYEIARWRRQTLTLERDTQSDADYINNHAAEDEEGKDALLDRWFPQHTSGGNCLRPWSCDYIECCFGPAGEDPLESGLYQIRVANHPQENEDGEGQAV
jgi:hypothetical protein